MTEKKDVKKVVLAYSGGLDTSVILKWLQVEYNCEVVTFTADLGQGEELEPARRKAERAGVKEIYIEDLREEFVREFVFPMFRANAVYEGLYLLGTSIARPLIAKRLVEIAEATGADAIALVAVLGALLYLTHFAWQAAVIGGIGLAMSSTAMALQLMREKGMNRYKERFAVETEARTFEEALRGADVFVGLSIADQLSPEMLLSMADDPIVFALANPDPEISPELAHATRSDVIMATGRSDYPNQVNNVLGFPFIFRGALDVRAKRINEEMKIAAALALRDLAKLPVPAEVCEAYGGQSLEFGREYIIPKPMDPRLITLVSDAVAKAAIESGVATLPYPANYPLKSVDDVFV